MAFNPINGSMLRQKEKAKAPHPALVAGALAKHLAKMVGAESPTVRVLRRALLYLCSRHIGIPEFCRRLACGRLCLGKASPVPGSSQGLFGCS